MTDQASIFNGSENSNQAVDNAPEQGQPATSAQPDPVSEYVGEGKKYRDINEALKATDHAQEHISNLEKEMAELREELNKRLSVEEALEKAKVNQGSAEIPSTQIDETTIKSFVKNAIVEAETEKEKAINTKSVVAKLSSVYGDKAEQQYIEMAQKYNLPINELNELAGKSPTAVLAMFGIDNSVTQSAPQPSKGSVNTEAFRQTGVKEGTYAYYENMRRENPSKYFSPKVQQEMHKLAVENKNFYS